MKRSRVSALAVIVLTAGTLGFALTSDSAATVQSPSALPRRAVGPFLAADSVTQSESGTAESTISVAHGGTLISSDGRLTLTFPAGAVAADLKVSVAPLSAGQLTDPARTAGVLGGGYNLQPDGAQFARPVVVTYSLGKADLAQLDPVTGVPVLGLVTGASGGKLTSLGGSASVTDWDTESMTLTGTTSHFSQVWVVKLADTTFTPEAVVSFVGAPAWTVAMTFTNPYSFPINMTGITYESQNPIGRPGLSSAPNFSVAGHGTGSLASSPPTFDCRAPGDGAYFVNVAMNALGDEGFESAAQFSYGHAWCIEKPVFKATLQPPSTVYVVSFTIPSGRHGTVFTWLYRWQGAIGCGTFEPFSEKPTDFKTTTDPQAKWTHPNAPDPSREQEDRDRNGVPDFCPHSEEPNFSHPGTISVEISVRNFPISLLILCTYSGSLSGIGECRANAER